MPKSKTSPPPNRAAAFGPQSTEADLLRAARANSEPAIRELIRRNNPRLFRVARGIVGSDTEAEDVVQETYLTAFRRLGTFQGRSSFATWLTRIAINTALMQRRRARPQEEYDTVNETESDTILPFPSAQHEASETRLGRSEMRRFIETAVADLPPDLRLVFVLNASEGMSIKEIAHDIEVNPITVKTRLFRARRRLRAELERQFQGGFEAIFPFDGQRCAHMADRVVSELKRGSPSQTL